MFLPSGDVNFETLADGFFTIEVVGDESIDASVALTPQREYLFQYESNLYIN